MFKRFAIACAIIGGLAYAGAQYAEEWSTGAANVARAREAATLEEARKLLMLQAIRNVIRHQCQPNGLTLAGEICI